MYYNICEFCGANLDPGEKCDCQNNYKKEENKINTDIEHFKIVK